VDRARAVRPEFAPRADERAAVVEIVRRLDGLPLAIELAAARLHTHEVDEVIAGLDRPLSLLSTGYRTSPRHSSLAALVTWSYELLDDGLQETFAAVSVFSSTFSVDDAAAVCASVPGAIANALDQLVERSLVTRAPGGRFALLETLRAFGHDRLIGSGCADAVGERHARRMVEWAEGVEQRIHAPDASALADVDDAIVELRSALGWLLEHREIDEAGQLIAALVNYAVFRLRTDVLSWAQRVIAADPHDNGRMASQTWAAAAYAAWMTGDVAESGHRSRRAVAIAEHHRSPPRRPRPALTPGRRPPRTRQVARPLERGYLRVGA